MGKGLQAGWVLRGDSSLVSTQLLDPERLGFRLRLTLDILVGFRRASFASWLLMNLLIVVVPRYGAYQMVLTGGLLLFTNFLYWFLIPSKPPLIRFEDHILQFKLGTSFWIVLAAGESRRRLKNNFIHDGW